MQTAPGGNAECERGRFGDTTSAAGQPLPREGQPLSPGSRPKFLALRASAVPCRDFSRPDRHVGRTLVIGLLTAILWCPLGAAAAPAGPGQGRVPAVTVALVAEREVNPPVQYVGRVQAIQSVDLRAQVQGYLEQVNFREGADVQRGELLYQIEQGPYRARVNEARAKVARAEATLTKADQYLKRLKSVRSGGVSATDIDTATAEQLQAKAQLQEAEANLEQAELDLGYTTIKAPIDGRIGHTAFTPGNLVGVDSGALARIVQINPIRVVYSVSENEFVTVKMAHRNESREELNRKLVPRLKLPNGEAYGSTGRLDFADNQVDPDTGTIAVWAVFDNPDAILLPGQYVNVLVSAEDGRRLPVVPQAAIQEDSKGRYVFVVNAGSKVEQRRIETGPSIGTDWAVKTGLKAGEKVIVQGVQKVRPGQLVKAVEAAAANQG